MLLNRVLLLLFASSFLILSSCAHSLVYDPSLHLPARPMTSGQAQTGLGTGYFLETIPDSAGQMGNLGGSMLLRYQFTKASSIRVGYWTAFSTMEDNGIYRGGLTADFTIALSDETSGSQLFVIPRSAILLTEVLGGVAIEGAAFSVQAAMATRLSPMLRLYGGAGPVFGFRKIGQDQWGLGALLNAGLGVSVIEGFSASMELSGTGYYDAYQETAVAGISPSLMLSYVF